jgi:hypothetical protein
LKNANQLKASSFKYFIIGYQLKNIILNFLKLVVVRSFCFGLILSPPLALIAKNGVFRALFTFSPMVQMNMSEDYTKVESGAE